MLVCFHALGTYLQDSICQYFYGEWKLELCEFRSLGVVGDTSLRTKQPPLFERRWHFCFMLMFQFLWWCESPPFVIDFRPFVRGEDAVDQERATKSRKKGSGEGKGKKWRKGQRSWGVAGGSSGTYGHRKRNCAKQQQLCSQQGGLVVGGGGEKSDPGQIRLSSSPSAEVCPPVPCCLTSSYYVLDSRRHWT